MRFENVTLSYGNKPVLKNLNLTIEPGEFVFLIGWSGSWKTSFTKCLIGDMPPKEGKIFTHEGKNLYSFSRSRITQYRRKIGIVFQDYKLLLSKTVRENVAFAMEVCDYPDKKILSRVPEILQQVGLLAKKESFISALSGWEAQRVAIARALIHDPNIIIGDEPTGNLDRKNAEAIMEILEDFHKRGKTVIIATHDSDIVNRMKKRVIAFENGEIISDVREGTYVLD